MTPRAIHGQGHSKWACNPPSGLCRICRKGAFIMPSAAKTEATPLSDAQIVEAYLTASMTPDPDAAAAYMKPGTIITFTGGREFDHPRGPTGFHGQGHPW